VFKSRREAGFILAKKLANYRKKAISIGITRGGVVVAKAISDKLKISLSAVVVKKIGAPGQEELAIGAVGPHRAVVLVESLVSQLKISREYLNKAIREKEKEVEEKEKKFGINNLGLELRSALPSGRLKTVILVDDGIATGATTEAAIKYLRKKRVGKIVLAVPVMPEDSVEKFKKLADELIVLETPLEFHSVGEFYENFPQVTDEEVINLLHETFSRTR